MVTARRPRPAPWQGDLRRVGAVTGTDPDQHTGGPSEEAGGRRHRRRYALSTASGAQHLLADPERPRPGRRVARLCALGKATHSGHNHLEPENNEHPIKMEIYVSTDVETD